MKSYILKLITILIIALSGRVMSQAAYIHSSTNNGASYFTYNAPVPIVSNLVLGTPGPFTMYNFEDGKEYKIKIYRAGVGGFQVNNLQIFVGNTVVGHDFPFTWSTGNKFYVSYNIPMGTAIGQYESITFEIFKKTLGLWFSQSVFNYQLTTTCMNSFNFNSAGGYAFSGIDYEVSNTLSVSVVVNPNGGLTEFDAGESVSLLPGFASNIIPGTGGAIQVIIDGCGGAYRMANPNSIEGSTNLEVEPMVKVYPNPVQNQLSVVIPKNDSNEAISLRILDVNGKLVFHSEVNSETELKINTEKFDSGIYFLMLNGSQINHTQKIIKN